VIVPLLLLGMVLWQDYRHLLQETRLNVDKTAEIYQQHALNVFETHQLVSERVNDRLQGMSWEEIGQTASVRAYLQQIVVNYPQIQAIWLADAAGIIRNASEQLPAAPVNVADRDYFRALCGAAANDLFIGQIISGRVMKGLSFNIAHRRVSRTGMFDGVIIVTVFPEYFSSFWNKATHGENIASALIRSDGMILARAPRLDPERLKLPPNSSAMEAIRGREQGSFYGVSSYDGSKRYFAFRKVGKYNVYMVYGVGTRAVLREWQQHVLFYGATFGLATLALLLLALLAAKRARRQQEAEQALTRAYAEMESRVQERTAELNRMNLDLSAEVRERNLADEKLQRERSLLRCIIDSAGDHIFIKDNNGAYIGCNRAFEKFSGRGESEQLGKTDFDLYDEEMAGRMRENDRQVVAEGKALHMEEWVTYPDGRRVLLDTLKVPFYGPDGEVHGLVGISRDITDRRNLENQLRQSQKMEAIGTLAGGIAHDFNNILTAIIGFGSLLEIKLAKDDPLIAYAGQILAAADRAANLTRSLLAFSRNQPIATKVVDLGSIVTGLEKMLHRLIREDIELVIVPSGKPLPVLVDAGQIDQVLINLATNARDAMPGGGRLTITIDETLLDEEFKKVHGYGASGGYARLVIADSGEGMAENVRQRIFDPFFTTKEVGKGTGLGLSVCYGIIKQHDGYINCYSEPGKGTTFRIYLPLVHGELEEAAPAAVALPAGGTETILLAEDDPAVRSLTSDLLREFGYAVIEARDGEEAVALYREHRDSIRLCLFDVIMPKKNGWEAFAAIVAICPDARGLFMSGYQADTVRLQDLAAKGSGFIAKPVVPRELLSRIRELLDS
jgi:PAS domain S-box-containing protein